MESEVFLQPRFTGPRFEGGVIPLHMLADLTVLEQLIVEVAKAKYKESHDRQRVPRGFVSGISLKLAGIESGSAIVTIKLVAAAALAGSPALPYFHEARGSVLGAISAANKGESVVEHVPPELLGYFDRFGRSLEEGEAIAFTDSRTNATVELNQDTRRKLVFAADEPVTEDVILHGTIPEIDQHAGTFQIRLLDGTKIKAPLTRAHREALHNVFDNYRLGRKVRLFAVATVDRSGKPKEIEQLEHADLLDPLDIAARLEELSLLSNGWYEGEGVALPSGELKRLAALFESHYPNDLPLPHLYPTIDGGVRAEWTFAEFEVSLDIELRGFGGSLHALNTHLGREFEADYDFLAPNEWKRFATDLRDLRQETV